MTELKSNLIDRKLRFDGVSEIHPDQLARFLLLSIPPEKLRVTEITPEIEQFNFQVGNENHLHSISNEDVKISFDWQLPIKYSTLDLWGYFANLFEKELPKLNYSEEQQLMALDRITYEMSEIENRGMTQFFRSVIFIIDEFKSKDIVWGVGRGSSCASYLLFLIGLHVVDCVIMDVDASEFFHE